LNAVSTCSIHNLVIVTLVDSTWNRGSLLVIEPESFTIRSELSGQANDK
jgi:hypothetical protein